jgi:hypothetical protein
MTAKDRIFAPDRRVKMKVQTVNLLTPLRHSMVILAIVLSSTGCESAPVKSQHDPGTPWISPHGIRQESDSDTLEYLMSVQRYTHEHGRLPRPDAKLDWQ